MKRYRLKLTVFIVCLVAVTTLGTGLLAVKAVENSQKEQIRETALQHARLISAYLKELPPETSGAYAALSRHFSELTGHQVEFYSREGTVLGEESRGGTPKEVREARDIGAPFHEERVISTGNGKAPFLFMALPLEQDTGDVGFIRLGASLEEVHDSTRRLSLYLLAGFFLLFAVAAGVSYKIADNVMKPLETIMDVAQQITHMNYGARVSIKNKDEIGKLGDAINTMASSLQTQMDRIVENESRLKGVLENLVTGVLMIGRDGRIVLLNRAGEAMFGISAKEQLGKHYSDLNMQLEFTQKIEECLERKERIREEIVFYFPEERMLEVNLVPVRQGKGKVDGVVIVLHDISAIRRLERIRSEFVANVSHELKTPIASVKGFAETLLAGAVEDKETARSFLQIIYDESERLNRLILDILDLSKIESKRSPLHFSPIEMKGFVEKTIHMMHSEAEKKNIELQMDVEDDVYLEADEDRLRQVLINLLSNGINYTPDGGRVRVQVFPLNLSTEARHDRVRIEIVDTGMGIPKKDLPRIFERFYRVDKARSRSSGGTGLGLSIVKHIVELHKGTIKVDSEVGIGTRFTIELPVIQ